MATPTPLREPEQNLARAIQRGLMGSRPAGTAPVRPQRDRSK